MPNRPTIIVAALASTFAFVLLRNWAQSESEPVTAVSTQGKLPVQSPRDAGSSSGDFTGRAEQSEPALRSNSTSFANRASSSVPQVKSGVSDDVYAFYDSQIQENLAPPSWFYADRNVYDEVIAIDATASIAHVACGNAVCRVDVRHENAAARDKFASQGSAFSARPQGRADSDDSLAKDFAQKEAMSPRPLAINNVGQLTNTATLYSYPEDDPSRTIMYVIRVASPEEMMQKIRDQLGVRVN